MLLFLLFSCLKCMFWPYFKWEHYTIVCTLRCVGFNKAVDILEWLFIINSNVKGNSRWRFSLSFVVIVVKCLKENWWCISLLLFFMHLKIMTWAINMCIVWSLHFSFEMFNIFCCERRKTTSLKCSSLGGKFSLPP